MGIYCCSPISQIEDNPVVRKEFYTGKELHEKEFNGMLFYEFGGPQKKDELLDNIVELSHQHSGGKMDKGDLAALLPKVLDYAVAEAKAKYVELRTAEKSGVKAYTKASESICELINSVKDGNISKTRTYGVLAIMYEVKEFMTEK